MWPIIFALAIATATGFLSRHIPYSNSTSLIEGLRSTSSIVFGVIGVWYAVISPKKLLIGKLSASKNPNTKSEKENDLSRLLDQLRPPILWGATIICYILAIQAIAPVAKQYITDANTIAFLRGLSYGTLSFFAIIQILSVFQSLSPLFAIYAKQLLQRNINADMDRFGGTPIKRKD